MLGYDVKVAPYLLFSPKQLSLQNFNQSIWNFNLPIVPNQPPISVPRYRALFSNRTEGAKYICAFGWYRRKCDSKRRDTNTIIHIKRRHALECHTTGNQRLHKISNKAKAILSTPRENFGKLTPSVWTPWDTMPATWRRRSLRWQHSE